MLSTIERVLLLQEVEILQAVSTEFLGHIAVITEEIECSEGDTVYREGDPAEAMYVVVGGEVRLHRDDRTVMTAGPNDAFGVWALFEEEERLVTATCTKDTRLLCLTTEDFLDLLSDHSEITRAVLGAMARRLRGLAGRVSIPRERPPHE
jgi:CRP-like cAMP-binding protein